MSYGPDFRDLSRRAAGYRNGSSAEPGPPTLPSSNRASSSSWQSQGRPGAELTTPRSVILRADQVIE